MTKYTDEQLAKLHDITWPDYTDWDQKWKLQDVGSGPHSIIDYLRTDAKADIEAGFWDEPLDPIEQARRDAREICAEASRQRGRDIDTEYYLTGNWDEFWEMRCVFRAICQERGLDVPE